MVANKFFKVAMLGLLSFGISRAAGASTIQFQFNSILQTGALAGTAFTGTASYNNQGITGVGMEYVSLTSINFTLGGLPFTLPQVSQGGQAILQDGTLSYFTAAFFPSAPYTVNDIAFGFGGPGIIGYSTPPGFNPGLGAYTLQSPVPEPSSLILCATAIILLTLAATRSRPGSATALTQQA